MEIIERYPSIDDETGVILKQLKQKMQEVNLNRTDDSSCRRRRDGGVDMGVSLGAVVGLSQLP
jgi:hypothetical protein